MAEEQNGTAAGRYSGVGSESVERVDARAEPVAQPEPPAAVVEEPPRTAAGRYSGVGSESVDRVDVKSAPALPEEEPAEAAVETVEPVVVDAAPSSVPPPVPDESQLRIAKLETELKDTRDRMLRAAADLENFRRRVDRERQDYLKFAHERVLKDLLPVLDNLGRAIGAARSNGEPPALITGVEMVSDDLFRMLRRYGVEPIDTLGKPFDPLLHEAVQQMESDIVPAGAVLSETQRAMVVVARAPEVTSPGMRIPVTEPDVGEDTSEEPLPQA
jgi:molecular chaperone GrpE